ncbi:MAG: hypothetical protein O7C56_03565 [Rickettsia endosymbiont of Ixodes persulcatus]|nr:hypothetical protein [Rickettsia endosymbiont of Ixodes persulcatus]
MSLPLPSQHTHTHTHTHTHSHAHTHTHTHTHTFKNFSLGTFDKINKCLECTETSQLGKVPHDGWSSSFVHIRKPSTDTLLPYFKLKEL